MGRNVWLEEEDFIVRVNDIEIADLDKTEIINAFKTRPVSISFSRTLPRPTFTAAEEVEKLGMQPGNWPPGWVYIRHVDSNSWASNSGIEEGWAIVAVNGTSVDAMEMNKFRSLLKARPVTISMSAPSFEEYRPPPVVSSPGLRFSIIPGQPLDISPYLATMSTVFSDSTAEETTPMRGNVSPNTPNSGQVSLPVMDADTSMQSKPEVAADKEMPTVDPMIQATDKASAASAVQSGPLSAPETTADKRTDSLPSVMEGWLEKRGPTANYKWLKRWCVLKEDSISFYTDSQLLEPKGDVKLKPASRILPFSDKLCQAEVMKHRMEHPFGFVLDPDPSLGKRRKLYYFDAGSAAALASWTQAFDKGKSGLKVALGQTNSYLRSLLYSGASGRRT